MALPDPSAVKVNPGRLCMNPTDLALDFPHGGTALGLVMDSEWKPNVQSHIVTGEEYGTPVDVFFVGGTVIFAAQLRDHDADAISAIFPDVDSDGTVRFSPGDDDAVRAGTVQGGVILLFTPDDEDNSALIMYRAVPLVEDTAAIRFTLKDEVGFPVVFHGLPDEAGRVYAYNRLSKLKL